jgi:uncharacterized membrane protein affecting hemolysin expression
MAHDQCQKIATKKILKNLKNSNFIIRASVFSNIGRVVCSESLSSKFYISISL